MAPRKQVINGVNLGGWLVLEPWMTPSLFKDTKAADEYTFCMTPGARKKLTEFRKTFITEKDIAWIAAHGLQAVRLPVGYWLFGNEAPYFKTSQYVDRLMKWAEKYEVKVLLDFHGAPNSQNGKMHSGKAGLTGWLNDESAEAKSLAILERLGRRYGKHPALYAISLLNEPDPNLSGDRLESYYAEATTLLRSLCHKNIQIIISDSFSPRRWRNRLPGQPIDHHQYQLFNTIDKHMPVRLQLLRARFLLPRKLRRMARTHPVVIGEWSAVLRGDVPVQQTQQFLRLQTRAFKKHADAYFYWSYKTEGSGPWNYRANIEQGRIID